MTGILTTAVFLRFYNLMWGNGYFFNPDENNMANAVSQLSLKDGFHPHFFAYGQLPLYLAYVSALLGNTFKSIVTHVSSSPVSLPDAIYWLRFWSAIWGVVTVFLSYRIIALIANKKLAIITAGLIAFIPGLIQSSHFGTTESLLTALYLTLIYICLQMTQAQKGEKPSIQYVCLLGLVFGLSLGIKLSSIYFIPPVIASLFIYLNSFKPHRFISYIRLFIILIASTTAAYVISSPYNVISIRSFLDSMKYEVSVVNGLDVFYTRQFFNTTPYLFQLTNVFPYVLGWPLFVFTGIGLLLFIRVIFIKFITGKYAKKESIYSIILLLSFLSYFIPVGWVYAKWTRFMSPLFPLVVIIAMFGIYLFKKTRVSFQFTNVYKVIFASVLMISIVPGIQYFQIFTKPDVRILASEWIYEHIPDNSYILSETGNVVDIPVAKISNDTLQSMNKQYSVISFDFYHLDENPRLFDELINHLEKADYIIIPSRRIFINHRLSPERYPLVNVYYTALFSGELGFELEKEIGNTYDEQAEETWSVFDHPVVRIYRKIETKNAEEYDKILQLRIKNSMIF
jgi:hypothetical protein